jgi:hypothetical protein
MSIHSPISSGRAVRQSGFGWRMRHGVYVPASIPLFIVFFIVFFVFVVIVPFVLIVGVVIHTHALIRLRISSAIFGFSSLSTSTMYSSASAIRASCIDSSHFMRELYAILLRSQLSAIRWISDTIRALVGEKKHCVPSSRGRKNSTLSDNLP